MFLYIYVWAVGYGQIIILFVLEMDMNQTVGVSYLHS